jgi:hypothetical protein
VVAGDIGKRRRLLIKALSGGRNLTSHERGAILADLLDAAVITAGISADLVKPSAEPDVRQIITGSENVREAPYISLELFDTAPRYRLGAWSPRERRWQFFDLSSADFEQPVAEALAWAIS